MYVHRILCSTTNMHFNITQHVVNTFSWLQNREYSQSSISGRREKKLQCKGNIILFLPTTVQKLMISNFIATAKR